MPLNSLNSMKVLFRLGNPSLFLGALFRIMHLKYDNCEDFGAECHKVACGSSLKKGM